MMPQPISRAPTPTTLNFWMRCVFFVTVALFFCVYASPMLKSPALLF